MGKTLRAGVSIKGKIEATPRGVPQGSPLSPLLANIMLDDLDRFLENKGDHFARYADDFFISTATLKEGKQIMQEVIDFLTTLKRPINEEKSLRVRHSQLTFLGYQFRGRFLLWSQQSLKNFTYRIRQLTNRNGSVSWDYRYQKLKEYLTGWINYFSLSIYDPVLQLDDWIRRRIRACYLK